MSVTMPATTTTRTALKEWAVACEALGGGQQILLLRKGGISEEHKEFRVEHSQFLLFPTYEHQREELLKPPARPLLHAVLAGRPDPTTVTVRYWASVADVFQVTESHELEALAPFHIWSDSYALERLRWRPRKPLQVLALRVYRLPAERTLPLLPEYGGCKSWLTLQEDVDVKDAAPVLGDADFELELERVRHALAQVAREVGT